MKLDNKLKERLEEKMEVNYVQLVTLILEMETILTTQYKLYYSRQTHVTRNKEINNINLQEINLHK